MKWQFTRIFSYLDSRATVLMMATGASVICLGISAMLPLARADAEEKPAKPSQPSLIVTPSSSMAFSGPRGGPFSPERFEFRVSSTTGTVNYSISVGRVKGWTGREPGCVDRQSDQRVTSFAGGDAPDFVEVGEAGIAMDDAMRRQRRVQLVG